MMVTVLVTSNLFYDRKILMLRTTTTATTTTRGQAAATAGLGNASAGPPTRIDSDAELEIYHKYLPSHVRKRIGDSIGIGLVQTSTKAWVKFRYFSADSELPSCFGSLNFDKKVLQNAKRQKKSRLVCHDGHISEGRIELFDASSWSTKMVSNHRNCT